jgi:hypothetical protein
VAIARSRSIRKKGEKVRIFWQVNNLPSSSSFSNVFFFLLFLLIFFFCHQVVLINLDYLGTKIKHTAEDHGSDCESSMFTTRPGSFPLLFLLTNTKKLLNLRHSIIMNFMIIVDTTVKMYGVRQFSPTRVPRRVQKSFRNGQNFLKMAYFFTQDAIMGSFKNMC